MLRNTFPFLVAMLISIAANGTFYTSSNPSKKGQLKGPITGPKTSKMPLNNPAMFRRTLCLLDLSVAYPMLFGDIHAFYKNGYGSPYSFMDADFRVNMSAALGYRLLLRTNTTRRYAISVNLGYLEASASDVGTKFATKYDRELNTHVKRTSIDAMISLYELVGEIPIVIGAGVSMGWYESEIFAAPDMIQRWQPYLDYGRHRLVCGLAEIGFPLSKTLEKHCVARGMLVVTPYLRSTLLLDDRADGYVYSKTDAIPELGVRVALNFAHIPELFRHNKS